MEEYFEYAVRIDCAKNGCETPHNDDGFVWSDGGRLRLLPHEVNRHAVTRVRRLIGMWEVDPTDMSDLARTSASAGSGSASTSYSG
jgi:hypothetical protein